MTFTLTIGACSALGRVVALASMVRHAPVRAEEVLFDLDGDARPDFPWVVMVQIEQGTVYRGGGANAELALLALEVQLRKAMRQELH